MKRGIIVAASASQEWLLPWWWGHYERFNRFPVTFFDLGLSPEGKRWCEERGVRGEAPRLPFSVARRDEVEATLVKEWEFFYGGGFWEGRPYFFYKPFLCLASPYEETLWLDLDCEVRCEVDRLFAHLEQREVALSLDWTLCQTLGRRVYNSGVVLFRKGAPLFTAWAEGAKRLHGQFYGDQELLSHLIEVRGEEVALLSPLYQWSHLQGAASPLAQIVHWHGKRGKEGIRGWLLEGRGAQSR